MKNLKFLKYYMVIGIMLIAASCEKEDGNIDSNPQSGVKRLKATVFESSNDSSAFIYNSEGLLSEIQYYTGTYNNNYQLVYVPDDKHMSFTYNNGLLSVKKYDAIISMEERTDIDSLFYDSQDRIEKVIHYYLVGGVQSSSKPDTISFQYDDVNRLSMIIHSKYSSSEEFIYGEDGNITRINDIGSTGVNDSTLFSFDKNINPYKNNPYQLLEYEFFNNNNVVEKITNISSSTYTYAYDNDGYPIAKSYYFAGNQFITKYFYE